MAAMAIIDGHDVLSIIAQAYKDQVRFTLVRSAESWLIFSNIFITLEFGLDEPSKSKMAAMPIIDGHDVL
jgi:hypothetical protein